MCKEREHIEYKKYRVCGMPVLPLQASFPLKARERPIFQKLTRGDRPWERQRRNASFYASLSLSLVNLSQNSIYYRCRHYHRQPKVSLFSSVPVDSREAGV